jgi:hypothetical protein
MRPSIIALSGRWNGVIFFTGGKFNSSHAGQQSVTNEKASQEVLLPRG